MSSIFDEMPLAESSTAGTTPAGSSTSIFDEMPPAEVGPSPSAPARTSGIIDEMPMAESAPSTAGADALRAKLGLGRYAPPPVIPTLGRPAMAEMPLPEQRTIQPTTEPTALGRAFMGAVEKTAEERGGGFYTPIQKGITKAVETAFSLPPEVTMGLGAAGFLLAQARHYAPGITERVGKQQLKELIPAGLYKPELKPAQTTTEKVADFMGQVSGMAGSFVLPMGAGAKVVQKIPGFMRFVGNLATKGKLGQVVATGLTSLAGNIVGFNIRDQVYTPPDATSIADRIKLLGTSTEAAAIFAPIPILHQQGTIGRIMEFPAAFLAFSILGETPEDKVANGLVGLFMHGMTAGMSPARQMATKMVGELGYKPKEIKIMIDAAETMAEKISKLPPPLPTGEKPIEVMQRGLAEEQRLLQSRIMQKALTRGEPNAIQEPSTTKMDVGVPQGNGPEMGGAYAKGKEVAGKGTETERAIKEVENAAPTPIDIMTEAAMAPRRGEILPTALPSKTAFAKTTPPEVRKQLIEAGATEHPALRMEDLRTYAADEIAKDFNAAEKRVFSGEKSAEVVEMGAQLRDFYRKNGMLDREADITDHVGKILLETGRASNAAKDWYAGLSPEGFMRIVSRDAKRRGFKFSQEQLSTVRELKRQLDVMPEGNLKETARGELLNKIVDMAPRRVKWVDYLTAVRYTNMLSSPRTTFRNLFQNAFNTLITRPAGLLTQSIYGETKAGDAFRWFSDMGQNWGNAIDSYRAAMKDVNVGRWMEAMPESELGIARQQKIPKMWRMIPQFMNAQDKFFTALVGGAERMRLMRAGADGTIATRLGNALAERYMVRNQLGTQKAILPHVAHVIDQIGRHAEQLSHGYMGPIANLFVPFIRTPTNAAARMVESSPLGFIRPRMEARLPEPARIEREYLRQEQFARAIMGTTISAIGAAWAFSGDNATWLPPSDPESKKYWHATGKKPFSVRVGNAWVPMWYLGPFALAVAIPAAAKYQWTESKKAKVGTDIGKMWATARGLLRFLASQTATTGVENFFSLASGDEDYSLDKALAFTASQGVPFSGMVRYVNTIMDPTFRRTKDWKDQLAKDLPWFSENVEPYLDPSGKEAKRGWTDWVLPYTITAQKPEYTERSKKLIKLQQERAILNEKLKESNEAARLRRSKENKK